MEDNYIEFENGSKVIFVESKETIRSNSSKIIFTPCGYQITEDCNCKNCLWEDCEFNLNC